VLGRTGGNPDAYIVAWMVGLIKRAARRRSRRERMVSRLRMGLLVAFAGLALLLAIPIAQATTAVGSQNPYEVNGEVLGHLELVAL